MEKKKEYHIQMLDNGIILQDEENELLECEKFSNEGRLSDEAMYKHIGKNIWADIFFFCEENVCNKLKVTVSIKKED